MNQIRPQNAKDMKSGMWDQGEYMDYLILNFRIHTACLHPACTQPINVTFSYYTNILCMGCFRSCVLNYTNFNALNLLSPLQQDLKSICYQKLHL